MNRSPKKSLLPVAFWALSAVEAFATLFMLLRIPPDPKHAILAGFSTQRLVMFSASILLAAVFLGLAWVCAKDHPLYRKVNQILNDHSLGWTSFLSLLAAVISAWLLLITPPWLSGAAIERLRPYLILMVLVVLQGLLVFWYNNPTRFHSALVALRHDFANPLFQAIIGWTLLFISFFIGLATVFFTYYNLGDEGDALTTGWLISQGKVLYRDIFSHHFPFPYLWTGLVMRIFGPSILAARLSVVVLRSVGFAAAMKFSRWTLPSGIVVFAWSLISPLFLGNMLMYDSFGALLLAPAVLGTLAYLTGKTSPSWQGLIFIGGMAALASLSDPTVIVPGLLLLCMLFLSGLREGKTARSRLKIGVFRMGVALLSMGLMGGAFLVSFTLNGSLVEFYRQAIWFNRVVYTQYSPMPNAIDLLKGAVTGLGVLNPYWQKYPGLYYQWTSFEELDQWIFTGLFFRLAVIGLTISFLIRRKWLEGISVYLIASTLLWRAAFAWHAQAFMLFSVVCAVLLVAGAGSVEAPSTPERPRSQPGWFSRQVVRILSILILLPVGWMLLWLNLRAGQFWVDHRAQLRHEATFSGLDGNGGFYRSATCHLPDASILVYPGNMLDYLAAQLPPATRYPYMLPWVAEVGQGEVITQLRNMKDQPVMVSIKKSESVWGYPVKDYLHELIQSLDQEYIQVDENIYISPGLKKRCEN